VSENQYDTIVVGAGAAGLVASASAAEKGAKVLLLEKMEKAGRKILITGKGRCNITNEAYASEFFKNIHPNGRYLKQAFSQFFNKDIIAILKQYGIEINTERGGRIFPSDNNAASVVNALMLWNRKNKVDIKYKSSVRNLLIAENRIAGVEVTINNKTYTYTAKNVIICTGGKSYPATGSTGDGYKFAQFAGHKIVKLRQALVPIETKGNIHEKLQGLSLKNTRASVWVNGKKQIDDFGEMLFTHFGLSGPIILSLSRLVVDELNQNKKVEISIDLKPALDEQKLDKRLVRDLNENGKKKVENTFKLWLPSKMIPVFINETNIDPNKQGHQITAKERKKIRILMKDFRFQVSGIRSFKEAIITAGGVETNEIDSKTMESKLIKNLFFTGEVLNLDANTGGYNLQIAWSTGWVAGNACSAIS